MVVEDRLSGSLSGTLILFPLDKTIERRLHLWTNMHAAAIAMMAPAKRQPIARPAAWLGPRPVEVDTGDAVLKGIGLSEVDEMVLFGEVGVLGAVVCVLEKDVEDLVVTCDDGEFVEAIDVELEVTSVLPPSPGSVGAFEREPVVEVSVFEDIGVPSALPPSAGSIGAFEKEPVLEAGIFKVIGVPSDGLISILVRFGNAVGDS